MAVIQAGGNAEVIKLLEHFAGEARKNPKYCYGALILVEADSNHSNGGWAGDVLLEPRAQRATKALSDDIGERIINRLLPPRDPDVPADYAIYNVPSGSISYDFIIWLVDAEMSRAREHDAPPLKVHFWFGRDGKAGLYSDAQKQMFEKVVRPSLELVGAVEHPDAIHGREYARRHFRSIIDGAHAGEKVPMLKAPVRAREAMAKWLGDGPPPVTITLREAEHWPHRNSNLDAWITFAYHLRKQNERVIFVQDTAKATEAIWNFETCAPASLDLHMRVALYERAKANLFVANGPCILAAFGDRPWLTFTPIEPDDSSYKANTPAFWRIHVGIDVGEQYPWSRPDQRIVWKRDDYENIVEAWDALQCVDRKTAAA